MAACRTAMCSYLGQTKVVREQAAKPFRRAIGKFVDSNNR